MGSRANLQKILEDLLGSDRVYFQPPPTILMSYPAIRYERSNIVTNFADNRKHRSVKQYTLTFISPDPDSDIPDQILTIPMSSFNRHFTQDGLNHDVFQLYY